MNLIKLDSLLVATGTMWLGFLLVSILLGVGAKPLDEQTIGIQSWKPYHHRHRDWPKRNVPRTVPDFVVEALETLHHREKRFPRVPMGTQCSGDSHCPSDHCCAMKMAKAVCQPMLARGRTCMVNGPRAYSTDRLFTQCPCNTLQGLSCARNGGSNRGFCS